MPLYKNHTGETTQIGLIAKADPKNPQAFIYASPADVDVLGVITQTVPKYAMCKIYYTEVLERVNSRDGRAVNGSQ